MADCLQTAARIYGASPNVIERPRLAAAQGDLLNQVVKLRSLIVPAKGNPHPKAVFEAVQTSAAIWCTLELMADAYGPRVHSSC